MKKIIITEFMDQVAVDSLSPDFSVLYDETLADNPDTLLKEIRDADAIIVRNRTQVKRELLAAAEKLTVVGRLGVGMDNIDQEVCRSRNIAVFPATGANDAAVAEYVVTSALMLLRRSYLSAEKMKAGQWPRTELMGNEIGGKLLGLIGFGAIARETCRIAKALGMNVAAYDPFVSSEDPAWEMARPLSLEELLSSADVISLHVPLTPETRHLVNSETIARMKEGVIVVNAARGGVVDENALLDGLKSGRIGGAAIDVFETEPLEADSGRRFEGITNLILTPHIGGVTIESNVRVSAVTAENVRKALEAE
ncbi:MAG: hydroxyacid dehydrogenase [Deltaproteobacteria bacterium]|mgnify:CR=1 FL=1|jgi:(S)-sulfolactate dehydrogenase|nr:hydroxyacid dehydrogenase [Deltaproteobacteria bacterium]MBT6499832.1 hydroxyacid dehydrogenase [Deltaproteobacteria bacterium]MBT7712761.1 hydroxyacid dehydrogenase [Deltaproteobacteria bacterium]